jgi:hypothetical protein
MGGEEGREREWKGRAVERDRRGIKQRERGGNGRGGKGRDEKGEWKVWTPLGPAPNF